ncbi:MAG: GGDEF domain-containing protein [Firmicutes bacterium]|nr:GGDEF domain-containing protein [Bacillota bacterium]
MARARRYARPVSCVLIDIDGFKAVNDTHGHPAGNVILGEFARLLRNSVRASDIIGRYGGEEFLLVLPETDLGGAVAAAERLRRAVEETVFRAGTEEIRLTISVGVASLPAGHAPGGEELLTIVDRAVYRAKALGRNRVAWLESEPVIEGDEPVE